MLDVRLLIANVLRWKPLLTVTVLTVVVAFFFFGLLLALDRVFNAGVSFDKADRIVVANAVNIAQPLPLAYEQRIAENPKISAVSRNLFFGGFYQDPSNGLMAIATDPESLMKVVPEMRIAKAADLQRWLDDPASIAVGRTLAKRFDWKIGDLVPIFSYVYARKDGGVSWTFRVAAIYDSTDPSGNTNSLLMHYGYVDEGRANGKGTVGWFNVRLKDPRDAGQIAQEIDAMFANSPYETHTATEAVLAQELVKQVGDFGLIVRMAIVAVFFTLVLVTANGMIHSVNERTGEFATMKALGASDAQLAFAVLAESMLVISVGAVMGFVAVYLILPEIAEYSVILSSIHFEWRDLLGMAVAVVAISVLTAIAPARQAWRVDTTTDLGRAA